VEFLPREHNRVKVADDLTCGGRLFNFKVVNRWGKRYKRKLSNPLKHIYFTNLLLVILFAYLTLALTYCTYNASCSTETFEGMQTFLIFH